MSAFLLFSSVRTACPALSCAFSIIFIKSQFSDMISPPLTIIISQLSRNGQQPVCRE
nr:MAG TPA: hypothetical protein [Caudoviricetes sp.]